MIDHTGVGVSDRPRARRFHEQALAPRGAFALHADGHNIEACCRTPA